MLRNFTTGLRGGCETDEIISRIKILSDFLYSISLEFVQWKEYPIFIILRVETTKCFSNIDSINAYV